MFDDISFLVQETFKDAQNIQKNKNLIGQLFQTSSEIPGEVSGVLFHIQKSSSTFVIRTHISENLKNDYLSALKHPGMYPSLRFEAEDKINDELYFFECDDLNIAKAIKSRLSNKRFPIFEEQVFNLSDPGDSWWLTRDGKKLNIFFKLTHTENANEMIKLGPLGNAEETIDIFSKLYGYFQMLFKIEDYAAAFDHFSIAPEDADDKVFNQFCELISKGETNYQFWETLRELEINNSHESYASDLKKANYFLMELAELRKFWCKVQSLM